MKYIYVIIILLVLFIIYSATDYEYMADISKDAQIVISDNIGNLESISFPVLCSELDKDPNNYKRSVPVGAIIMWSGALTTIPRGWKLCDGVGSTPANDGVVTPTDFKIPDLRGRFIVGVNPAGNNRQPARNAYEMAAVGGAETHTLTVAETPAHRHQLGGHASSSLSGSGYPHIVYQGGRSGSFSDNVGGGQPHNNLPPYYTLAYIIKVV